MDFNFTREENEFREEVINWLKENLPHNISEKVRSYKRLSKEDYEIFMKKLSQKGWLAINWPVEYGGTGWSTIQKHIFEEEIVKANAPRIVPFGLKYAWPSINRIWFKKTKRILFT